MATMNGLHIVIVPAWWPAPEQPIAGIFNTDYARAFASAGAKVGVIFPDLVSARHLRSGRSIPWRPKLQEEDLDGIPVIRLRGLHTAMRLPALQMVRYRRWLRRGLSWYMDRHGRPDVLHAMCAIPAAWACTHLDDPLSRRVVVTEHTGSISTVISPVRGKAYALRGLQQAAAVVAVSKTCRDELRTFGLDREIEICGNCVSHDFHSPEIADMPTNTAPKKALFVGRLTEAKGVCELVDAAMMLAAECDIQWHFVGDGPMGGKIRRRFETAGLRDGCHIYGTCNRSVVAQRMKQSDFLVLPSHGETFGMAVAEALCMGLPVVTTRGSACAGFVTEENGILAEKGDVGSLAAAMRSMIHRLPAFDRRAIARHAWARFSPETLARWYAELFDRIIRRP